MSLEAKSPRGQLIVVGHLLLYICLCFQEKKENLKILSKTDVMYLKRKLRTCRIQIQVEKV